MLRARASLSGIVSAPHHLAAQAGRDVLREGGTAVEAMVAAAATIAVVYPHMNALGGDGFWLIAEPGQDPVAIRACGPAAARATPAFYREHGHTATLPTRGPLAALTVAGAVAGWAEALALSHAWGGRPLPVSRLLVDAVHHARTGVVVSDGQAALTAAKWGELATVPGFAATFAPEGLPPLSGTVQHYPALAETVERLGRVGLDDFYRGEVARALATGLEQTGAPVSLADLDAYRAARVAPLKVGLKDGCVFGHPPPTQGVATLMILGLFDRLGVREADGFAHVHGLVEATKRAFLRRDASLSDPARMTEDPADWLLPDALTAEAARIDRERALPWPQGGAGGDTVWMGAADREGRVVSYIQSVYWEFGSGLVVPGTGVTWQNRGSAFTLADGPNRLEPGRLPVHTLNPSLARLADGRVLAFGTMGGEGQPQTQAAVFTRYVRFGQDLQATVTAPRWLLGRTWGAETTTLKVESRMAPDVVGALEAAGHAVEVVGPFEDMMGHAGAISVGSDGVILGASDPRADGACAAI
ncbi:gamma-glutamyltransferase [Roseospira marina]|uniref:Gamma-glutamyltransferase n=1 Tax=Roseospira marina TaxID=140057 RepID=A0A5M6IH17_9PROT|nr:gamma-glutamyltransferase [Roseospira marina]KAA5607596.1 gamma-glutamyltransferase [Roseospira marina]MBB4312209.1 gamma-glutamyltranspeptidase/glutathione hydrolase [Roseospira marina]MBB5085775.1 gamma-glutamyltranspeptidase/glutathione hydrolase [Roseospira marina]